LQVGFIPLRKPGKLPHQVSSVSYDLEYGSAALEMHVDAIEEGPWPKFQRVTGTNTELAGTCLCSISPNMGRGPDVCEIPWFLAELKTGDLALSVSAESWKAASASELLWEAWENEFTVYHRQTGETHILNALPAEIVHLLGETSMTTSELANELAVRCEVEETPEWSAKVTTVLENLYRLSLVEKASR